MSQGKSQKIFTEKELVSGIISGNNDVFKYLYFKLMPSVVAYVVSNSGNEADARDLFQDALVVVTFNLKRDKYAEGNILGYIMTVCTHTWLKKIRSRSTNPVYLTERLPETETNPIDHILELEENEKMISLVNQCLEELDEKCRFVLKAFYFFQKNLQEIAAEQNWEYSYAKKKIFLCRSSLKNILEKHLK